MPTLSAPEVVEFIRNVLVAVEVPAEDATVVARELCDANLVGHDSHGIMRLVQYVEMIDQGFVKPGGPFEIVRETASSAVADAHFNFGQVAATKALDLAMNKAREQSTATVFIRDCNHVGRLGSYTHHAAREGFAAMMAVNAPGPGGVAPFGGIERRLGTNPISIAAPARDDAFVLDMTTSATAEGKLRVAHQKGELVGEGLLINGLGEASTNPGDYYTKPYGAILPLGGATLGHKGFGLSVMIDVICGIISGSGVCRTDLPRGANGVWLYLIDIKQFVSDEDYERWMSCYIPHIKECKRMPNVTEIFLPGEIEVRMRKQREQEGIQIPEATWQQLNELAARVGASVPTGSNS